MKTLVRIISAALCVCLCASALTGCHKKNETALTVGDTKVSSGMYLCMLINADQSARSKVEKEQFTDKGKEVPENVNYTKYKLDGHKYDEYVEIQAVESCAEYVYVLEQCEKNKITLDKDTKSQYESAAKNYWDAFYGKLYSENGVSQDTYNKFMKYSYMKSELFSYIYGKGGKKEVSADDKTNLIYSDYMIADTLSGTYESGDDGSYSDTKGVKAQMQGYADRLNNGESFDTIYTEYNGKDDETDNSVNASDLEEEKPADSHATVISKNSKSNNYGSSYENLDKMFAQKVKTATVYENSDGSGCTLIFKGDIKADKYYLSNLDSDVLLVMKSDEFDKDVHDTAVKKQKIETSWYAINRFSVDDFDYDDYKEAYQNYQQQMYNYYNGGATA